MFPGNRSAEQVREYIQSRVGLRPNTHTLGAPIFFPVREYIQSRVGLRPSLSNDWIRSFRRQRVYPVQSRIKTVVGSQIDQISHVREYIQSRVGLRPHPPETEQWHSYRQRVYPVQSRIKTSYSNTPTVVMPCQRVYPVQSRIKTVKHNMTVCLNGGSEYISSPE